MGKRADREALGLTEKNAVTGTPLRGAAEKLAEDYQRTFGDDGSSGARVLADLRRRFGTRKSFVPGATDVTAFHEGQRDVYQMILHFLDPTVNRKPTYEETTD